MGAPQILNSTKLSPPRRLLVFPMQNRLIYPPPDPRTGRWGRKNYNPQHAARRSRRASRSARASAFETVLPDIPARRPPRPPGRQHSAGIRPPLSTCCPHAARFAAPPPRPGSPDAPGPRLRRGRRRPGPRRGPGTDVLYLRLAHTGANAIPDPGLAPLPRVVRV